MVVSDFDLTLTAGSSAQCHDVFGTARLPDLRAKFAPLLDFSTPFPTELQGDGWWRAANAALCSSGAGLRDILPELVGAAPMRARPGAVALLRQLVALQVPVLIVSAGFCDVIEAFLASHGIPTPRDSLLRISSNRIHFEARSGDVSSVSPDPPVTSNTKSEAYAHNAPWFDEHSSRHTLLVLGDRVSDLRVLDGVPAGRFREIIRIGILNDEQDFDQPSGDFFRRYFDAIVCGDRGSLEPLVQLLDGLDDDDAADGDDDGLVEVDGDAQETSDGNALLLRPAPGRGAPEGEGTEASG